MFNNKLENSQKDDNSIYFKRCIEQINRLADNKDEKSLKVISEFINGYSEEGRN